MSSSSISSATSRLTSATALERETADFVRDGNSKPPGLAVFDVTRDAFIAYCRSRDLLHESLKNSKTARLISEARELETGGQALLARVFMSLWTGDNFSPDIWSELIALDPATADLAVEACYWVLIESGADGARELASVLAAHNRLDAVHTSNIAALGEDARAWARRV